MAAPYYFKAVYILLFAVASVTQYSYFKTFGRFISEVDFSLVMSSDWNSWRAAIQHFSGWNNWLPVAVLALLIGLPPLKKRVHSLLAFAALAGLFFLASFLPPIRTPTAEQMSGVDISSTVLFYKTFLKYASFRVDAAPRGSPAVAPQNPAEKNLVLIIDESIRADHLSINGYSRMTSPYLAELQSQGLIKNYGAATSGATCSPLSNAMLLTGVPPSENTLNQSFRETTLFQYAKAAGYKTTYIDCQSTVLWNGLSAGDLKYVDSWIRSSELDEPLWRDFKAAELIRKLVLNSKKNLIVLNKQGAHFEYEDHYPADQGKWQPLPPNRDYKKYPELVSNPYDNAILFSVDNFFRSLLPDPETFLSNATIIYTSDHAQTLHENGVPWLHCNNSIIESQVPLIIFAKQLELPKFSFPVAHQNILPTALELLGYKLGELGALKNSLLNPNLMPLPKCFVSGAMHVVCDPSGASSH